MNPPSGGLCGKSSLCDSVVDLFFATCEGNGNWCFRAGSRGQCLSDCGVLLIESLEQCLHKKVDLVTEQGLNKYVRPYVLPVSRSFMKSDRVYLEQMLESD
jgi:hypothetical protein